MTIHKGDRVRVVDNTDLEDWLPLGALATAVLDGERVGMVRVAWDDEALDDGTAATQLWRSDRFKLVEER